MPHIHIRRSMPVPIKTKDTGLSGSLRSDWHSDELDLGKQGFGEVEYQVKISYQFTVDLAAIKKSGIDWYDDGTDGNGPKSKNPPWDAIERAISRIIQSSGFRDRLLSDISEKLG